MAEQRTIEILLVPKMDEAATAQAEAAKDKLSQAVSVPVGAAGGGGSGAATSGSSGVGARVPHGPATMDAALVGHVSGSSGPRDPAEFAASAKARAGYFREQDRQRESDTKDDYRDWEKIQNLTARDQQSVSKSIDRTISNRDRDHIRSIETVNDRQQDVIGRRQEENNREHRAIQRDRKQSRSDLEGVASSWGDSLVREGAGADVAAAARASRVAQGAAWTDRMASDAVSQLRDIQEMQTGNPLGLRTGVQGEADAAYLNRTRYMAPLGGGRGGAGGGGGNGAGVPWYRFSNANTAFGMPMHVGPVAAAYAAYRFIGNDVSAYDAYQKPEMLRQAGFGNEGMEAAYSQAKEVNSSWFNKNMANVQAFALGSFGGNTYIDSKTALDRATKDVMAVDQLKTGQLTNATSRYLIASNSAAQVGLRASTTFNPLEQAESHRQASIDSENAAVDFEKATLQAKITDGMGARERADLENQIGAVEAQRNRRVALVTTQAQAGINQAILGHNQQMAVSGYSVAAGDAAYAGDEALSMEMGLRAKYQPMWDSAASQGLREQYAEEFKTEWRAGNRAIRAGASAAAASVWGAQAALSGDFDTQRNAIWADFGDATQGMDSTTTGYQNAFNSRMAQDVNLSGAERSAWAYAGASGAVATAAAQGQGWTAAHMGAYQQFQTATANAQPGSAAYTAASNEFYGHSESLKRQQWISNEQIKASTASSDLAAQFKPVTGSFLSTYNQGAISALANPEQSDLFKSETKSRLGANWAHYLSATRMSGGAEGFSWQVGTSGQETGYEDLRDLGSFMTKLNSNIDKAFTPLANAYGN
jgi:hypothetical protein